MIDPEKCKKCSECYYVTVTDVNGNTYKEFHCRADCYGEISTVKKCKKQKNK